MCACFSDLPVELHRLILSFVSDSFSLHRLERVCVLWNELVAERERRGLRFRRKKVKKIVNGSIDNNFLLVFHAAATVRRNSSWK